MSKTATALLRPSSAGVAADLMTSLAGLLRKWLPRQRWFGGKDRPVADLALLSMTELYPGCLHLLVHTGQQSHTGHGGVPAPGGTPRPVTAISCCSVCASIRCRTSAGRSSDRRTKGRWRV